MPNSSPHFAQGLSMCIPTVLLHAWCRDSHIKQIYAALRCFMTDFWRHSQGECAASATEALQFELDDVTAAGHPYRTPPRCLHLIGDSGARICLVHSPKGDMFFGGNPEVSCMQVSGTARRLYRTQTQQAQPRSELHEWRNTVDNHAAN